jgi:hypothetical protein
MCADPATEPPHRNMNLEARLLSPLRYAHRGDGQIKDQEGFSGLPLCSLQFPNWFECSKPSPERDNSQQAMAENSALVFTFPIDSLSVLPSFAFSFHCPIS